MNTLKIIRNGVAESEPFVNRWPGYTGYVLLGILLLLWPLVRQLLMHSDPTAGYIDQSIWLLVLFSMICFMLVTGLCWWLLQRFWLSLGLPALGDMVEQFNSLVLWQKLVFYWASFGLLLLAAVGALAAIL
ncbi:vacuolar-type H+-ATPase subunit I/STV1 [Pedobacter sp. AK017]|uniref:hypothetical protein n=1 Tax=Pedobacter sp. AK017 TaxID=2723073 RepID=UPI0016140259|nr:hypothetical protein [Pedobacter sp. AK017]MBB5438523.1 vacuolar-type H+-ATPase subunit I/STV1 [Pedobacter sp. AK017]